MIDDVALGALGALAGAGILASEGRAAGQMGRTVRVGLALVAAALEGPAPEARQTSAHRHAVVHLALGVHPAGVRVLARRV